MIKKYLAFLLILLSFTTFSVQIANIKWFSEKHGFYSITFMQTDEENINEYGRFIEIGRLSQISFFNGTFGRKFEVIIHPDRRSLDSSWQKDWNMPGLKSECWMVASGVANKLDMLSLKIWDKESCEHKYNNTIKTHQLITHALVHVYHGQHNASPDFNSVNGIEWFVVGLATYASGQCDF